MLNLKNLIFFISLSVYTATAQTNFVAGTIIQLNGDTVKGQIEYKEWIYNPKFIRFRTNATQIGKAFTPKDIKGFTITSQNEKYQSAIVDVNNESLDGNSPNMTVYESVDSINNASIVWTRDTVFLSVLAQGRLNLFELSYYIDGKAHYLVQKGKGKIEELIYRRVKLQNHDTLGYLKIETYRAQLHLLTFDCTPNPITNLLPYVRGAISNLVNEYNQCQGQSYFTGSKKAREHNGLLSIMGGLNQPSIHLNDFFNANGADFKGQQTPSFGLAYAVSLNVLKNKIAVGVEFNFAPYKVDVSHAEVFTQRTITINYTTNTFATRVSPYLLYYFTSNGLQPYIKGGLSINHLNKADIERVQTDNISPIPVNISPIAFAKNQYQYLFAAGLTYKHWFIEPQLNLIDKKKGQQNENQAFAKSVALLCGYSFSVNKKIK
jgi:hypothetical protein